MLILFTDRPAIDPEAIIFKFEEIAVSVDVVSEEELHQTVFNLLGVHDKCRTGALRFRRNDKAPFLGDENDIAARPFVQFALRRPRAWLWSATKTTRRAKRMNGCGC